MLHHHHHIVLVLAYSALVAGTVLGVRAATSGPGPHPIPTAIHVQPRPVIPPAPQK